MEVYKAINAVSLALSAVGVAKNSENREQKYSFRGIDAVYNALAPLLAQHKLVIMPRCVEHARSERVSAKGTAVFSVVLKVEFDFVAIDGSKHTVVTYGEAMDYGDKATNKAMSAAYKYAAFQTFCIPTEETAIDADASTFEVTSKGTILAKYICDHFVKGDEWGAFEAWELETDNEVKLQAWSFLDSKTRSTIKAMKTEANGGNAAN